MSLRSCGLLADQGLDALYEFLSVKFFVLVLIFEQRARRVPKIEVLGTGPYALLRHPMYSGALVMFAGVPLALGSWWGLAAAALMVPVFIWRLLDEEKFLAANLPGYGEYQHRVRYRLVPLVW